LGDYRTVDRLSQSSASALRDLQKKVFSTFRVAQATPLVADLMTPETQHDHAKRLPATSTTDKKCQSQNNHTSRTVFNLAKIVILESTAIMHLSGAALYSTRPPPADAMPIADSPASADARDSLNASTR
jgi:hypothetical protein